MLIYFYYKVYAHSLFIYYFADITDCVCLYIFNKKVTYIYLFNMKVTYISFGTICIIFPSFTVEILCRLNFPESSVIYVYSFLLKVSI